MRWMVVSRCDGYFPPAVRRQKSVQNIDISSLKQGRGNLQQVADKVLQDSAGGVDQTAVFNAYIQQPGDRLPFVYSLPAWLSQVSNVVRVFGRPPDVFWTLEKVDLKAWEKENQEGIQKLCAVVEKLMDVMKAEDTGEIVIEGGMMRVTKVDCAPVTPKEPVEQSTAGKDKGKKKKKKKPSRQGRSVGGATSYTCSTYSTDSTYERYPGECQDWSICDKDCGWCGRCMSEYGGSC